MADFSFEVSTRTEFGKGFARRARAAGKIPATVYAKGAVPEHITLPAHETTQAVRLPNALFEVKVGAKTYQALVKDIQRDFVTRDIEHIDLFEIKAGQKVTVPVELKVTGESQPGTYVATSFKTVTLLVDATKIPRFVELSVEGAGVGDHFTIADINLSDGAEATLKADTIVSAVKERSKRKEAQIDVAGGGDEESAAEGESASEEVSASEE